MVDPIRNGIFFGYFIEITIIKKIWTNMINIKFKHLPVCKYKNIFVLQFQWNLFFVKFLCKCLNVCIKKLWKRGWIKHTENAIIVYSAVNLRFYCSRYFFDELQNLFKSFYKNQHEIWPPSLSSNWNNVAKIYALLNNSVGQYLE